MKNVCPAGIRRKPLLAPSGVFREIPGIYPEPHFFSCVFKLIPQLIDIGCKYPRASIVVSYLYAYVVFFLFIVTPDKAKTYAKHKNCRSCNTTNLFNQFFHKTPLFIFGSQQIHCLVSMLLYHRPKHTVNMFVKISHCFLAANI